MTELQKLERQERIVVANDILRIIAAHGRRFFSQDADRLQRMENPRISRFEFAANGRLWFIDKHSGRRIFVHYEPRWRGGRWRTFTEGGTLHSLIEALRDYILRGDLGFLRHFGPWQPWVCGGDLWGYGDDMAVVRAAVAERVAQVGAE